MSFTRALYIGGEWVETDDSIENINPSDTTESVGRYAQATPELADHAIASANRAAKEWGQSPMETRYQMLMAIGKFQGLITATTPIGSRRVSISMPGRTESTRSSIWR